MRDAAVSVALPFRNDGKQNILARLAQGGFVGLIEEKRILEPGLRLPILAVVKREPTLGAKRQALHIGLLESEIENFSGFGFVAAADESETEFVIQVAGSFPAGFEFEGLTVVLKRLCGLS